jgi:hypothetical protein
MECPDQVVTGARFMECSEAIHAHYGQRMICQREGQAWKERPDRQEPACVRYTTRRSGIRAHSSTRTCRRSNDPAPELGISRTTSCRRGSSVPLYFKASSSSGFILRQVTVLIDCSAYHFMTWPKAQGRSEYRKRHVLLTALSTFRYLVFHT